MFTILRQPDDVRVIAQNSTEDAQVRFELEDRKLSVYLQAKECQPEYICLRWNHKITEPTRIMGDKWARGYGDMEWHALNGEIFMPWYFLTSNGKETVGCGVMVQPNSFICFQCDASGVTAWFDVRCGARGVELNGRELLAGVVVCEQYENMSAFQAATEFCKVVSPNPILPKSPVYGSNNWYYAYGKSSYEEIMEDAKVIADLAGGNENPPFMVIDDGWQLNTCAGPWLPNEAFRDMKMVVDGFHEKGLKAGLWYRALHDLEVEEAHPDWLIERETIGSTDKFLDPSHPDVQEYLRETLRRIKRWGFDLVKHDYSTYDLFGNFGFDMNGKITVFENWSFYDRSKTSAEIVLDFYRLLREEAGEMLLLGCDTVSHLCAGLVEINRIGDDTSGRVWGRTRAIGVNSLAFRLCQNGSFYAADADCVGVLEQNIDWKLNKQWLDLLARSGSPLFVSVQPSVITDEMAVDLKEAFRINSVQWDVAEPLDWEYNNQPQQWRINGEIVEYDFVMDSYPDLITRNVQRFF